MMILGFLSRGFAGRMLLACSLMGLALASPNAFGAVGAASDHSPSLQPTPEQLAKGYLSTSHKYVKGSAKLAKDCSPHAIEGFYAACEAAWNAVWTCPASNEILCEAAGLYAESLEGVLTNATLHGRLDGQGLWIGSRWKPICVPLEVRAMPIDPALIQCVVAVPPPCDKRISRQYTRGGFGLPVSVRVAPGPKGSIREEFAPPRQSIAATAVLRFKMPGDENVLQKFSGPLSRDPAASVLDLANPIEIAAVHIGLARPLLAADFTAPLLDMLEGMPQAGITGFLQPYGAGNTQPRLEFLEPHVPARIPVVFIHGLASDEGTWFDMLNELRTWPTFHRRYEPWVYHYPTGASFLQSAAVLRKELQTAVLRLDPEGVDRGLKNMVLIGHSMGGLHAKLQVVEPGNTLWDSIACTPFDEIVMRPEMRAQVGPSYFFRPLPFVKRVVYIATPHGGSTLASLGIGRVASLTVRQPPELEAIHTEVVQSNPGAFHADYTNRLPTTVDILEPKSTMLQAIQGLRTPCWVTTHSIIGTGHQSPVSGPGDCIVPASSAHVPGVVSQINVPATHTRVHHQPATILEVQRILAEHLRETGLE